MALIKCPECGRESVSSSAASCPTCGFGIKSWYDEQERQKLERQTQEAQRKQYEAEHKAKVQQTLNAVDVPTHRPFINGSIILGAVFTLFGVLFCYWYITNPSDTHWGFTIFVLLVGLIWLALGIGKLKNNKAIYDKYHGDTEAYRRYLAEAEVRKQEFEKDQKETLARARADRIKEEEEARASIKCPACGSKRYKKISLSSKVVSTEMLGLASSKVGKTFQCKTCGYKW